LFFRVVAGEKEGQSGTYIYDLLQAGTPNFCREVLRETEGSFNMKSPEMPPITFTGIEISRDSDNSIAAKQGRYISTILKLARDSTWEGFRSERQKLACICRTRPDNACAVSFAQQATERQYLDESIKAFSSVVLHLHWTSDFVLKSSLLYRDSL
jgi:hypothetical protein